MIDRKKVIKAIENNLAENYEQHGCADCPYNDDCHGCATAWKADALALLKEQYAEIRQLRLALDIAKGTCKGIVMKDGEVE